MMNVRYYISIFAIWLFSAKVPSSAAPLDCSSGQYERCLYEKLFNYGYNPKVLPRKNISQPIVVSVHISPYYLVSISEIDQTMTMNADWSSTWQDEFLTWDPADYNNVDHLTLPANTVWLPDAALANSADAFYNSDYRDLFQVVIQHDGTVFWEYGGLFNTLCPLDFLKYPFDQQTCKFIIENWSYTKDEVLLEANGTDLSELSPNGLWDLVSFQDESYIDLGIWSTVATKFTWVRKSKFYLINVVLPSAFLTIMSLGVFWLPPECGEKGIFAITVLLCFTVYQIIVMGQTPPNSDATPLLTKYLSGMLAACATSVVSAMFVIYFNGTNPKKKVPTVIRVIFFQYLARILLVDIGGIRVDTPSSEEETQKPHVKEDEHVSKEIIAQERKADGELVEMNGGEANGILRKLTRIREELTRINQIIEKREKDAESALEWRMLAKVIERFIFACTFTGVIIVHIVLIAEMLN